MSHIRRYMFFRNILACLAILPLPLITGISLLLVFDKLLLLQTGTLSYFIVTMPLVIISLMLIQRVARYLSRTNIPVPLEGFEFLEIAQQRVQIIQKKYGHNLPVVMRPVNRGLYTSWANLHYGIIYSSPDASELSPEMSFSILVHEIGHMINLDTLKVIIIRHLARLCLFYTLLALGVNLYTQPIFLFWLASLSTLFATRVLSTWPYKIVENTADAFAAKMGYGHGWIKFLENQTKYSPPFPVIANYESNRVRIRKIQRHTTKPA